MKKQIKCSTPSNIVIRTVDTDVLIIALDSLHLLAEGKQIWIETGLVTKNTLRYININQIHDHFGVEFCTALPVCHVFSGCGYTASFSRKGKIRPKRFQSVEELRLELFLKKHKPNNHSLVDNVRKLDSATLPPCSRVLLKKLKRSSYIARLWRNCLNTNPLNQDVSSFGWRMKDGHYNIQWFDGDAAPKIVDVVHRWNVRYLKFE